MRLQSYLIEYAGSGEFPPIAGDIIKNCKPFIKQLKGAHNLLLRGSSKSNPGIIKLKPRKDRRPMSTPYAVSELLDEYFKKRFGWKPRSEGIFCTGKYNTALFYAGSISAVNTIWPIGNFKFLWSNEISDLFGTIQDIASKEGIPASEYFLNNPEELDKLSAKYQNTSLATAIDKGNEIMIGCNAYYMVNSEHTIDLKRYFNIKMG